MPIFRFGAFGCDHTDRNALPAIAHKKAEFSYNRTFTQKDIIIIGDTPNDVLCAQHYQARSVAVTTGPYSADQLRESNPDYVITSMQNPHNWLNELLQKLMSPCTGNGISAASGPVGCNGEAAVPTW